MYQKFKQLLEEHKTTAYRVCRETGIHSSTISQWKSGLFVCPRIKTLKKLADYFGVTVDYFLE